MGAYLSGCRVNKQPSPGSPVDSEQCRANNIYSPCSDKLTEVQLYMSTSCQPGSQLIRAFSDVQKPFIFSDLTV